MRARVTEAEAAARDLEPVAAAVHDAVQRDARAQIGEAPARQDRETSPAGAGEAREGRSHRWREDGGARRGNQRRQRSVVVEDHHETGALPELPVETVEETHRKTQDAFAPVVSTGILASSLSKSPAHR